MIKEDVAGRVAMSTRALALCSWEATLKIKLDGKRQDM